MTGSLPHTLGYVAHIAAIGAGLAGIERLTRGRPPSLKADILLALGCVAMAIASFLASDPPDLFEDFRIAYYPAGRAIAQHHPEALHALMDKGVSGFVNLPVTAYVFAPFAMLPPAAAAAMFTALGVAACYAAWRLLSSLADLDRTRRWQLALLFAGSGPLVYSLREGNISHMILLALAVCLLLLRQGRSIQAGIVLGLAAVLKPPLALMGLVFLVRKDARGLAGFIATGATAAALSLLLFGWAENLHWFQACVVAFSHEWIAAFNVQSIPAFLLRLSSPPERLMDWTGRLPPSSMLAASQGLIAAVFAVGAAALLRRVAQTPEETRQRLDLTYLLVLCLCVLASPLSWSHYYAWLLAPIAYLLAVQGTGATLRWTAILLFSPLVWPLHPSSPVAMAIYRTAWSSHLLLAGLLIFALIAYRLARTGGLARTLNLDFARSARPPPNDVALP